jgi:death-on-curing protein
MDLSVLLARLAAVLEDPVDFFTDDPSLTPARVSLLTGVAIYLNVLAVTSVGGRSGPTRGIGLVEQVVGAAFQTFSGADPYPGPFDKAAMLLRGITQGHPFEDGNKRTGFLLATYYLERVGYPLPDGFSKAAAEHLCLRISAGELRGVDVIADELKHIWGQARG